jgi:tripartite-type tricarboxylate transporter receptor subunit TctC
MKAFLLRRHVPAILLATALAGSAAAQEGTLRIVVGYPPGATSDALTRVIAEHMQRTLKQTVIVENKVGAGGRIANELVKAAPPDGNTVLMTPVATPGSCATTRSRTSPRSRT